jgi:prepilin-type N-terminal cleavage/methylation domain-containing protein
MSIITHKKSGFTLVELSIVIVVIGLIIGAVTAGSSLLRMAGLRAVVSELNGFKTAINTFKLQYNALPGDFNSAYSYWGASCAGSAGACNGNNNRLVWQSDIVGRQESYTAWKHMALAGIIPGTYSGNSLKGGYEPTAGLNVPASRLSNGVWWIDYSAAWYPGNVDSLLSPKSVLSIGAIRPSSYNEYPLLTPTEASSIDTKIDDGVPYLGQALGLVGTGAGTNCVTGSGASATYSLSQSGAQCWMWFKF